MLKEKRLIGRSDVVDFPKLELFNINVKIDTGAYTSSIHCFHIVENNGILECVFLDDNHPNFNGKKITFDQFDIRKVKSSNGISSIRYIVTTEIKIFDTIKTISISLTSRDDMKFPVLLGRKFISGNFIVDTELTNLSFKQQFQ